MTQFYHQSKLETLGSNKKFTVCLDLPPKEELLKIFLDPYHTVQLNCGMAFCSNEDNYSRKVGRDISSSRKKIIQFTCRSLTASAYLDDNNGYKQFYRLSLESDQLIIDIDLKSNLSRALFVRAELK